MLFRVDIDNRALNDIQDIVDYYNSRQNGLGKKFYNRLQQSVKLLKGNPYFRIRYDSVRCLPIKKFPYMIHFVLEGKAVIIYAILSTYVDPDKNKIEV